jgi:hypothetical protein
MAIGEVTCLFRIRDATTTYQMRVGVFWPRLDSAEAWILKSDRQVSYGESQGVTLSSDESNHAECKTNTHSM